MKATTPSDRNLPQDQETLQENETSRLISADKVQGTNIYNARGDDLGEVDDVMIDKHTGKVAYAVVTYGGFLGIGTERRALPWWLLGIAFLPFYQSLGSQSLYDTPEKLARFRATIGANAAMVAMSGPQRLLDTIGGDTLSRSPYVLAQLGRVATIVDTAQPQNLVQAWGKSASYHFVFTRQNRGKLDELSALVERGQLRPHVGAVYSLADIPLAHARLESPHHGIQGKIAIAVDHRLIS